MHTFYCPELSSNEAILPFEEGKHAVKVLRLIPGSLIRVIDGRGTIGQAEIIEANSKKCRIKILETSTISQRSQFKLHIAIAPTKSFDRLSWFIEKAVEIGVDEISFVRCQHSERKDINLERCQRIALAAVKQSLKAHLPTLKPIMDFESFITSHEQGYIAYCGTDGLPLLQSQIKPKQNIVILIGPEGDFSPEEIALAQKHQYSIVSLGQSRLRTETAGVVACSIANMLNEI